MSLSVSSSPVHVIHYYPSRRELRTYVLFKNQNHQSPSLIGNGVVCTSPSKSESDRRRLSVVQPNRRPTEDSIVSKLLLTHLQGTFHVDKTVGGRGSKKNNQCKFEDRHGNEEYDLWWIWHCFYTNKNIF
ncbi:hypothetical protein L6452_32881 [Arctium lappa]|uniref:Uncharacterized protein n=1 Tax=Arctium lappa TaxID=4217 RepID=A0ACB8Z686_ARCLA|nr:hypothetical protein L6452_32881 [Arctium lappa]